MTPEEQWLLQREKVLSWLRLGFALVAILVIYLNPSRVARFPVLSHLSLNTFLIYSLLALYLTTSGKPGWRWLALVTTAFDLLWISLIVLSTGGWRTPFFTYYFFPVIAASFRYGVKGSLAVALVGISLYGSIRFFARRMDPLAIDFFLVRSVYLLAFSYIFGFMADFEKKQGRKLMALSQSAGELAVQEERRRIGRELHDRLLQVLASLTLRLEACRRHLIQSPEVLGQELRLMEKSTREAMNEIRGFLAGKDGLNFIPGTLLEKIREEMRFLRDRLGFTAVLDSDPEELNLPEHMEWEIYLVLREGLTNVARHSQASEIALFLKQTPHEISGSIRDNGVGFDASNGKGYGLAGMRERVQKFAGRFDVKTAPGTGTEISFVIPFPDAGS